MPSLPRLFTPRRGRRPDAPALSGLLAILFWCACGIAAVPLAGIFSLIAALGPVGAFSAVVDSLSGQTMGTHWSLRLVNPDYLPMAPVQALLQQVFEDEDGMQPDPTEQTPDDGTTTTLLEERAYEALPIFANPNH